MNIGDPSKSHKGGSGALKKHQMYFGQRIVRSFRHCINANVIPILIPRSYPYYTIQPVIVDYLPSAITLPT